SPPTTPTNTSTAAPLPSTSGQASGTPPIWVKVSRQHWSELQMQSMSNAPLAIPLAQDLPLTNGQACHYECTLEIPNSLVSHVIRHQERGLKQAHDLSGSWLATFAVGPAGNEGHWFVTIRGTDQQIGEALVVIEKRIAKCQVHAPWKQKTGNAVLGVAAPALSPSDSGSVSSTPKPLTQQT
ncbi:hypothetical protein C0995_015958, partial [Termitomyces sp. Mi166